jgi:hypothetical protein
MRLSPVIFTIAAVVLALPFGWGLGVALAYAIAGKDFGQLPAGTVPIALMASTAFAVWPAIPAKIRCAVMAAGTAFFVLISLIGSPLAN